MTLPRAAAALAVVAIAAAGCTAPPASEPEHPSPTPATPAPVTPVAPVAPEATPDPSTAGPQASASPTPSVGQLDLTVRGEARDLVDRLMDAAGATRALMVTVTRADATVTVLEGGTPQTWAWRDARIQQVPSDITYVDQRTFDPDAFAFDDLGALFRLAEAVSGSRQDQSLQVVDYSGGLVSMSVSTNPESRAVFFQPDGTVLPTLDFTSEWGLVQGYRDAVGDHRAATALGFGSTLGVYLDTPQRADGGLDRRQRTARTPVLVTPRSETTGLATFDPALVDPAVVWRVLDALQDRDAFTLDTPWSCVVDTRDGTPRPRLYFTVGERSFVTSLDGTMLPG